MPGPAPGNAVLAQNILVCCLRPAANTAGWMRATAHYWTAGLMGWPESCNIVISEYYGLHNIVLRITPPSPWVAWPDLESEQRFQQNPERGEYFIFCEHMLLEYVYFWVLNFA